MLKHKPFSGELDKCKPNRRKQFTDRHAARFGHAQSLLTDTSQSSVFMTALSFILKYEWSILFLQKHCIVKMPVH